MWGSVEEASGRYWTNGLIDGDRPLSCVHKTLFPFRRMTDCNNATNGWAPPSGASCFLFPQVSRSFVRSIQLSDTNLHPSTFTCQRRSPAWQAQTNRCLLFRKYRCSSSPIPFLHNLTTTIKFTKKRREDSVTFHSGFLSLSSRSEE